MLINRLPKIRGKYRENADLSKTTWFQVGGAAEVLFKPEDCEDLCFFMKHIPRNIPVTVLGASSNVLVRDGGIKGVVIRLGRGFTNTILEGKNIHAGAAAMNVHVAHMAAEHGRSGLAFLVGIPGCVGGALAMNGGAYGTEVKDVLAGAEAVDAEGNLRYFTLEQLNYSYRHCGLLDEEVASCKLQVADENEPVTTYNSQLATPYIFTRAILKTETSTTEKVTQTMQEISASRENTQPIRSRTGGSTFKNPQGHKAWELIDAAGCRGLKIGGAQVSEKHCNFLINTGNATAHDIEILGEEVRARVLKYSGITLEWEIKRVGEIG